MVAESGHDDGMVQHVEGATVHHDDEPLHGVLVTPGPRWLKPTVIVAALVAISSLCFALAMAMIFIAPSTKRTADTNAVAATQRTTLIADIDRLTHDLAQARADSARERTINHCKDLFSDDIRAATGRSQLAVSDLFAAAVDVEAPLTAEQRRALIVDLQAKNDPLRAALDAYDAYLHQIPPPDVCPHPLAQG